MQGEQVELPLFEDGLKSQKVINEIKRKVNTYSLLLSVFIEIFNIVL